MKNKIKKHKIIIMISILIIIVTIFSIKLINDFKSDTEAIYGSRLEGIEKVKVTSKNKTEIIESIQSTEKVTSTTVKQQGKIINIEITLKDDTNRDDAKQLTTKILEKLNDEQKQFYDIQVFIKKTTDDATFPIIGYRHHARQDFSWTLDR